MLLTSRGTGRWLIPKGWPMPGLKPAEAAAREAYEEGGLVGQIRELPIGSYRYDKQLSDGSHVECLVEVYALEVERQLESWPEQDQRRTRWFDLDRAAESVLEPELGAIIRGLEK
jgi:8-oxo-dGTP pyrophosphatase MutT (NUDIX family)